jgi:outer membrane lipoprotein
LITPYPLRSMPSQAFDYPPMLQSITIIIALLLTGCASLISQEVMKDVDKAIRFEQLLENPEAYQGKTVLVGGDIIEARNYPEKTLIVVLQRPFELQNRPAVDGVSKGRFIVTISGFLDPAIYRKGRQITVVGVVLGKEVQPLGEIEYAYPVIAKRELHLWPSDESALREHRVHFGIGIGIIF